MQIGQFVKQNIQHIFDYCEEENHDEINNLLDIKYSKNTFGINFPFCVEIKNIKDGKRFWTQVYSVRDKRVRVTSQWYEKNLIRFKEYLDSKEIVEEISLFLDGKKRNERQLKTNIRYKGNHIGNAQNLFIRNILSNIEHELFSKTDWNKTKDYFDHKCAYCGSEGDLLMEHAIPINKEMLGEHRLGNLVPSCKLCNSNKGNRDFREFLMDNEAAINKIKEYMTSRSYVPIDDNENVKCILNQAHKEVADLADKYIKIVNELLKAS